MCKIPPGRIGRASESPLPIPLGDEDKIGKISVEDYADAMIDELEHPAHVRQRFTAGY